MFNFNLLIFFPTYKTKSAIMLWGVFATEIYRGIKSVLSRAVGHSIYRRTYHKYKVNLAKLLIITRIRFLVEIMFSFKVSKEGLHGV